YIGFAEIAEWQFDAHREHANNRVALIIQRKALAHCVRRGTEYPLAKSSADYSHGAGTGPVFARRESPPHRRFDAQHSEEIRGNPLALYTLGFAFAGQAETKWPHDGHRGECPVPALPVEKIWIGDRTR